MSIVSYCRRPVSTASPDETIRTATQRMEKEAIGFLVVTEGETLAGVLTDRDAALHVLAGRRDASTARVGDAMTRNPVAVNAGDSLGDTLAHMAGSHARRLPVVDGRRVAGVVGVDDLALLLAREMSGLGEVLAAQLPEDAVRAVDDHERTAQADRDPEQYARRVVSAPGGATASELAREMHKKAVGSVLVLDDEGRATGIVTDRDLALRVVAAGLDAERTPASEIMTTPLASAKPTDSLQEIVRRMRAASVRRMPILRDGRPVGLVAFDDLLVAFGRELGQLAECVAGEIRRARRRIV